jgi:hypothetical protein
MDHGRGKKVFDGPAVGRGSFGDELGMESR